jgi:transposase InsO family protein
VIRRRVAKRMRALGLRAKAEKKFKATTQSKHSLPVVPEPFEPRFTAATNRTWVSYIIARILAKTHRPLSANSRQSWHVNDRLLPEQFQTVAEQLVNELKVIRFA